MHFLSVCLMGSLFSMQVLASAPAIVGQSGPVKNQDVFIEMETTVRGATFLIEIPGWTSDVVKISDIRFEFENGASFEVPGPEVMKGYQAVAAYYRLKFANVPLVRVEFFLDGESENIVIKRQ